jgi:polysaccharide biosynthesis protein
MVKVFFKHGLIYTFTNLISRGISIILLPFYVRVLSTADYGIIDMLVLIGTFVNYIVTLEITQGIARFYGELEDKDAKKTIVSTAFWFIVIGYSLFYILTLCFYNAIVLLINIPHLTHTMYVFAVSYIAVHGISLFLQGHLRWQLRPKLNVVVNCVSLIITAVANIIFLFVFDLGVIGFLLGMIIGNAIGGVIAFFSIREIGFIFSGEFLKKLLLFSSPLVPSSMACLLATASDRFAINALMSIEDVGVYGVAYRLSTIVSLVLVGFQSALTPLVYTNYKDNRTKDSISMIFRYFSVAALCMFLGISIFSRELLFFFTTKNYYSAYAIIPYLVLSNLLSAHYAFFPGLGIANKTIVIAVLNIISAVANIGLNFLLIPYFGMNGAAFATFLSALLAAVIYVNQSQRYYKIYVNWVKLLFCFMLVVIAIFLLNYKMNIASILLSIFVRLILFSLIALAITSILAKDGIRCILKR